MTGVRDRLNAVPAIRWALTRRPVEHVVATVNRSRVVRGRIRFVAREVLRTRRTARYRLRNRAGVVLVRHGTPDVVTLDEVFLAADYSAPSAVNSMLELDGAPFEVLDLGANVGYFGVFLCGYRPDVTLTAVEPDAANAAVLREVAAANRGSWRIVAAAAATQDGEVEFDAGAYSLSRLATSAEPPSGATRTVVTAVDALELLARADLAKIDIEGGEWDIMCDERFAEAAPRALVLEYHPGRCPAADPHALARERLRAAGYEVASVWQRDDGHGVLWGWKGT